jgi:multicomponent Na+:H+ antiporter subunit D
VVPSAVALAPAAYRLALAPIVVLTLASVAIGLAAGPVFALAARAADQLLDPSAYVAAVRAAGGL